MSLLLLEGALRGLFSLVLNYDIEMWKYASCFKGPVPDARGHVHSPGMSGRVMGVPVRINSKGLRGADLPYEKALNTRRILLLGDSYAFGFGVAEEDCFAHRLVEALNEVPTRRYEVINMGVGNYNSAQELAVLKLEGYKYHPDHILLAFYVNDAEPAQRREGNLLSRHSMAYIGLKALKYRFEALYSPAKQYKNSYQELYKGENWRRYQKILEAFKTEADRLGVGLTVAIMPDLRSLADYPFREIHGRIADFFRSRGCVVIDTLDAFPRVPDARRFWVAPDDPHPNAEGHRLIAGAILRGIKP